MMFLPVYTDSLTDKEIKIPKKKKINKKKIEFLFLLRIFVSKNHKLDLTMPLEICKANYNTRKSLILPLISHLPASTMVLNKLLVSDDTEVFTIMTKNENENNNNIEKLEVICKAICILDSRAGTHLDVSYYNLGNRDDEFESNNLLVDFLINERSDNYLVFSGLNERYVERLCNAFNLIDVLRIALKVS